MNISHVKFAKSGDLHIAYQRWGSGPDVVVVPPLVANVELGWEQEIYRRVREYNGKYMHMLEFDKRGTGASDRFDGALSLADRINDIHAVMDAEGLERASLLGLSEGGIMAQYFASRYPERVDRVVLANSSFGVSGVDDLPAYTRGDETLPELEDIIASLERVVENWGRNSDAMVDLFTPSMKGNAAFARWIARYQRLTASRADMRIQLDSVIELDANAELADIKAPTLVVNVVGDRIFPPAVGRYLADKIPGARYEQFEGDDHFCWIMSNWREMSDAWIEFISGEKPGVGSTRKFATVLFTDIVGSTSRSAEVGDEAWRGMLDSHDRIAWKVVDEHRGKLIKNTGDGLLLTFDAPSDSIAAASALSSELANVGLRIRAGLHAGEVEVRENGDVTGLAVNLAARVQQATKEGATYVSSTLRDLLLGGSWSFEDRGEHTLKGIDGTWRLYELAQ
jgi:class 3 adenylate cyclase/pimeloyl-ACP methyl ester carboxylesterase